MKPAILMKGLLVAQGGLDILLRPGFTFGLARELNHLHRHTIRK